MMFTPILCSNKVDHVTIFTWNGGCVKISNIQGKEVRTLLRMGTFVQASLELRKSVLLRASLRW